MDDSGTVWQRSDDQWTIVIRGMDPNEVTFIDAWVSPTGVVIAVTEDAIYRLK